jgi:N-ethylmaleimide reductase
MTTPVQLTRLLEPTTLGHIDLANRVVMAPMTRNRATASLEPGPAAATYYAQRASAGLIVTEATQVSPSAAGYPLTPGLYTDAQVTGWRRVTDAVHARNGRIFVQLWHTGRISHPVMQPDGAQPVAPSAIAATGELMTYQGLQSFPTPRALELDEISHIVDDFRGAAVRAIDAGFDGVELHGANGYLIDQFLREGANVRTDAYGGSLANRARFLREVTEAVAAAIGADRLGVRISPSGTFNSMSEREPERLTTYVAQLLEPYGLAYLHVIDPPAEDGGRRLTRLARKDFSGTIITNGGYTAAAAARIIEAGDADLVSFGAPFIANPDLVERIRGDVAFSEGDRSTFYGGDDRGYIDYPFRDGTVRLDLDALIG